MNIKQQLTRVVGYTRVSTEEQAVEGVSLKVQREKLAAYAALYGLDLVMVVEDAGVSAKSLKRPGLQRCLAMLKNREVDGLVIAKLDRLTRSLDDWRLLINSYFNDRNKKCFKLLSVGDQIDTRTANGRMVLNILFTIAEWERETIGERTGTAMQYKIAKGERCGKVRFGYDLSPDGVQLIPNKVEQRAIQLMQQLKQEGQSLRSIAAELNKRRISTKEGKPWVHTTVSGILARAA